MTAKKRTTRKVARAQTPRRAKKMSFRQVERFAHDLAEIVMQDYELAAALLVVFDEIGVNCRDSSHVEGICIQMQSYIGMLSLPEVDRVQDQVIKRTRIKWIREDV